MVRGGAVNRSYPAFPTDPSDEELGRDWNLSEKDMAEVRRCRGNDNKHRFSIQLCALRTLGRFANDYESVPTKIVNHLGQQLGIPAALFVKGPERAATDTGMVQRIRVYLGYRTFDDDVRERLEALLIDRAGKAAASTPLFGHAVSALREWKVEIPAFSTLDRIVNGCASHAVQEAWGRIYARLPPSLCEAIDRLLDAKEDDRRSPLNDLKEYPPEARPKAILRYLERAEFLRSMELAALDLGGATTETIKHLAELGRRYDAKELGRFAKAKKYAIVSCFLVETQKTVLDHIVEMHRLYLQTLHRHAKRRLVEREHEAQRRAQKGLSTVLRAMRSMMAEPERRTMTDVYRDLGEDAVRAAVTACGRLETLGERGYFDEIRAHHHLLKRYLPTFLKLPFQAQPGTETLLAAVEIARALHRGEKEFGAEPPVDFAKAPWQRAILGTPGKPDVSLWEFALAMAVRDALQCGDLYLAQSRHHVPFRELLHETEAWEQKREKAYAELSLPTDADRALESLRDELDVAARAFCDGLDANPFASMVGESLAISKDDAFEEPKHVRNLRRLIEARLPRIRLEDLLVEVDSWCGFTRELAPFGGYEPRMDNLYSSLLAALVAHGTNLGIATMAQSTKGISIDTLQHVSRWYLGEDALKAASRVLVDYHHALPLSATWGEGRVSGSDGQRFAVQKSSLLAAFCPRYFGYYDRAITLYTHQADQWSVYGARAISCAEREATYVLDGLLENDTVLEIREHHTDTAGQTEHIFGLCHLLGFDFMPRFKDLADQKLYKFSRATSYGPIDPFFDGAVDVAVIREQWDELVRVASSLKSRTSPAHVVLTRLASSSERLAKALQALGRLLKTTHILRYLHDSERRARIQLQLNRGESRHSLARRIFFANRGVFRNGDYAEIMNKVSALSVISNAVLIWNTVRIGAIVGELEAAGHQVAREDLARISPLHDAHVIATGSYHFDRAIRSRAPMPAVSAERHGAEREKGLGESLG